MEQLFKPKLYRHQSQQQQLQQGMGVEWFRGSSGGSAHLSASFAIIGGVLAFHSINWLCGMTRLENLVGFVHPKYEKVEKVFRKNFHDGWEREGAAIAVYHKGELIVDLQDVNTFNDPELHGMEQVAALGITKARDLARLFSLMLSGKLFSKELVQQFKTPQIASGLDEIVMTPLPKGYGFLYERHPTAGKRWLVGHPGFGGSTVMMDVDEEIVVAYVTNGLKTGMGELTRTYRHLRDAVFECLEKTKEEAV
ncbi:hypothetical protein GCK32_016370 [Trichostrongylus colubriformis]|uniref:Beta-lactamase-related domain-containing protein n=1 Tax=Trichostrongylus colubriformis TaxID=6319 RepID=A0AAN8IHX4_TRICO